VGSAVRIFEKPIHTIIHKLEFLGENCPSRLFKLIALQVAVLIFGVFWHSSCSGITLYPPAFIASTILFIVSYFATSSYKYSSLKDSNDPKDLMAYRRFERFFEKYHSLMLLHSLELGYGLLFLGTIGGSTCEADGSDWILGGGVLAVFNHLFEISHLMGSAQSLGC